MEFNWRYTLVFLLIWFACIPIAIKNSPTVHAFTHVVIYAIGGAILYGISLVLINKYLDKKIQSELEKKRLIEEKRKKISRAMLLKQKYRYKKLDVKEIIADTEIDTPDKLILLEVIHGYTPDKAYELLKNNPA